MTTNVYLICLKAKIKGLADAGSRSRAYINATEKEKRNAHWVTKRLIGDDARHHIVAYGLLRDLAYTTIEPRCGEFNAPNPERVLAIIQQHCDWSGKRKWTLDVVKAKLERPKVTEKAA